MVLEKLFNELRNNIKDVIARRSALGESLWHELIQLHPADIAAFLGTLPEEQTKTLYTALPAELGCTVFKEASENLKIIALSALNDTGRVDVLGCLTTDELTDLFETLSDEELKSYLNLLHKNDRNKVLSLLKFQPESAGGVMDTDVLALYDDFTVQKSIQLLQRLGGTQEIHRQIFVTNREKRLVGHIFLEDLVLQKPLERLSSFMKKNLLVARAEDDQEDIAKKMVHYNITIVPVVGKEDYFLGVITSSTLIEIIEEESAENVYRMSAMTPVKGTYFDVSFLRLLYQRSSILIPLLLFQSLSSMILSSYNVLISSVGAGILTHFLTTLISTGGNAGSQTSAMIIQGMASGEIHQANFKKFIRREMCMAFAIALILSAVSFLRVYIISGHLLASFAVSLSLAVIVTVAIFIGSAMPIFLRRIGIDPAYSAGPALATLIDIMGIFIYCIISQQIFTYFANFS